MCRPLSSSPLVLATVLATGLAGAPAATAQTAADTCGATPISARGEPASYRWLALVKARGNWRTKIRGMQELGPSYANWSSAADQVERCVESGGSTVCTVTGRPCRK